MNSDVPLAEFLTITSA